MVWEKVQKNVWKIKRMEGKNKGQEIESKMRRAQMKNRKER